MDAYSISIQVTKHPAGYHDPPETKGPAGAVAAGWDSRDIAVEIASLVRRIALEGATGYLISQARSEQATLDRAEAIAEAARARYS